ncbi:MAG: DUF2865 domain-containing protein [Beijerinckiaceae bacterium]|nr:DUF2865 domain-containing protein [Beijerinckiaceae bacterium]
MIPLRFRLRSLALALLGAAGAVLATESQAQSPVCAQIRSELATMPNTGGPTRDSSRLRSELGRIRLAMQQNDCGRSSGFLGLGGPPPVCTPLRNQAAAYEAQIRQMEGGSPRRAQLIAALDRYGCLGGQQQAGQQQRGVIYAAPNSPSLFERLFGDDTPRDDNRYANDAPIDPDAEFKERLGGRLAVCVRTCDGFFFPVNFEGIGARDEYATVCQSLCPAAETRVFFMQAGADIERAASRDGTPYMSLPTAKKFQQSRDPACFCKPPQQTWANAMKGVEDIVETRKGDIVVSQEQALAMSRPKATPNPADRRNAKNQPPPAPKPANAAESEAPASLPESALPTGGNASAGIGPRVQRERIISSAGGTKQQVVGADGSVRVVRNVAPELTGKERPIDLRGEARP